MQYLSLPKLARRRLSGDWLLLLSIFLGVILATTLIAGAPVYLRSLERQSLNTGIDGLVRPFSNINVFGFHVPLNEEKLVETERAVAEAVDKRIPGIQESRERYLLVSNYLAGLPRNPLPESLSSGAKASRGYFRSLSNLSDHVDFIDGEMAGAEVYITRSGLEIEAVIGRTTARAFGLRVGDRVPVTPAIGHSTQITVVITGIVVGSDPAEDYWQLGPSLFLDPPPPEEAPEGIELDYRAEEPPVPLFITRDAMVNGVGAAFPGTLISSYWFIFLDTQGLKQWRSGEIRQRLEGLEQDVSQAMPGSDIATSIFIMLNQFESRLFFNRLPLLVLLTIMVATVLFYLAMTVSYLVQKREGDLALLRTRGVGTLQLLRLYGLEATVLTIVAVVIAPFLALGAVAMAGKLPYFSQSTGGAMLPVDLTPTPFLAALGAGLLSLAILLIPGLLGARSGLAVHKLRSSRPPTVPFFHRYYLDVGLLVLGGLIFWELNARGQIVSGGLFKDVQVNETLLIAPVLFLVVVALVFVRFFPLIVRFVSGESAALVHLLAAAALVVLVPVVAVQEARDEGVWSAVVQVAPLLALGGLYWATTGLRRPTVRLALTVLQAGAVAAFVYQRPPESEQVLFIPTLALMAVVPAQVGFMLLRALARTAPVWLSVGLWRMARNPLQYTWLIVLLLLATGLGILSTTVGGTLDRSQRDRIQYDVATDIRVSSVHPVTARSPEFLRATFERIPGVTDLSLGLRRRATVGPARAELLALESQEFRYMSWYRSDFSERPFSSVLGALNPGNIVEPVQIPDEAITLGMWIKPTDEYPGVSLRAVVEDGRGITRLIPLGNLGPPTWHVVRERIPPELPRPMRLVAVQLFELGAGAVGTPGSILFDDIFVTLQSNNSLEYLEEFEDRMPWLAVPTAPFSTDRIRPTGDDFVRGSRSARFTFGKDMDHGVRGFYQSPTGGAIPAVASASFLDMTGFREGEQFVADIGLALVPMVVRETVDYFPTLSPDDSGFLVVELDNLADHVKTQSPGTVVIPNEVFLNDAPTAGRSVTEAATLITRPFGVVKDLDGEMAAIDSDPLSAAGWRATVLVSMGVVLIAAGLGYVTYLLATASRGLGELGFLRSIGFSRAQIVGLLAFEHLAVAVVGLTLGTWAGLRISRLLVSSVSVTEGGEEVLPPYVLTTDWAFVIPVYAILAALFIGALYALNKTVSRLDLQSVSRVEGV